MEKVPVAVLPCRDRTRQLLQHSGCHWFPGTRCLSNHGREAHALCAALLKGVQVCTLHSMVTVRFGSVRFQFSGSYARFGKGDDIGKECLHAGTKNPLHGIDSLYIYIYAFGSIGSVYLLSVRSVRFDRF